jgi:PqqD family protein of HPr-rel-A system
MNERWAVGTAALQHVRQFDDDVVVYHDPSASTHLLQDDLAAVFATLWADPGRSFSVVELLTELGEPTPDETRIRHVCDILDSLQASGLAESRAP